MEKKGAVNQYVPHVRSKLGTEGILARAKGATMRFAPEPLSAISAIPPVFTINLANGSTPFLKLFNDVEYSSQYYRLTAVPVVSHVWYRPVREEWEELDKWTQEHVLNSGLLCAELGKASGLHGDPVQVEWDYERFQRWAEEFYGRRLPPQSTNRR